MTNQKIDWLDWTLWAVFIPVRLAVGIGLTVYWLIGNLAGTIAGALHPPDLPLVSVDVDGRIRLD